MNWQQRLSLKSPKIDFTLGNYQLSLLEYDYESYDYSSWRTFKYNSNKMMKGEDVKQLPTILNQFGANLKVDGYYGSSTKKAVMEFQKSRGLKVDGVVGLNTREEITKNLGIDNEADEVIIRITRITETNISTIGELVVNGEKMGYTLENPWKDNENFISRIPTGKYSAHIREAANSKWDYDVIELEDVPGREYIQIHRGNRPKDTAGCILVGESTTKDRRYNALEKTQNTSKVIKELCLPKLKKSNM